jgi:hypothetical protein
MKYILTSIGFFVFTLCAAQNDTIQVKVGDAAEILIIEKRANGFEEVSKLDLNKIFQEMNGKLSDSKTNRAVVKDFDGDSFIKKIAKKSDKYYLNYYVGFNYSNTYNIVEPTLYPNNSYADAKFSSSAQVVSSGGFSQYSNKVLSSPYLAVSVNKHVSLISKERFNAGLTLGLEPFFSFEKLTYQKSNNDFITQVLDNNNVIESFDPTQPNSISYQRKVLDTLSIGRFINSSEMIEWQYFNDNNEVQTYISTPYNVLKVGFNVKVMPKFTFYNSNGKRMFSFGIGPSVGLNVIGKSITKFDGTNISSPVLVNGVNIKPLRYGLVSEVGIGGITFFGQYNTSRATFSGNGIEQAYASNQSALLTSKEAWIRAHVVSFGLKFGK